MADDVEQPSGGRSFLDRLKHPGKLEYIGIGVAVLTLIVGYLAYRKMNASGSATDNGSVPADATMTGTAGSGGPTITDPWPSGPPPITSGGSSGGGDGGPGLRPGKGPGPGNDGGMPGGKPPAHMPPPPQWNFPGPFAQQLQQWEAAHGFQPGGPAGPPDTQPGGRSGVNPAQSALLRGQGGSLRPAAASGSFFWHPPDNLTLKYPQPMAGGTVPVAFANTHRAD